MAAQPVQENLPSESIGIFPYATQHDYELAKNKARELLRSVLPDSMWPELEEKGVIRCIGRRGVYVISPYSQTEIRDVSTGRRFAYACLQLSIPAPTYDRMIAEYLLIRNDEDVYWKTANIFCPGEREFGITTLILISFDIALFVNIFLELVMSRRFGQ